MVPPWRDQHRDPVHPHAGQVGVRETLATIFDADRPGLLDFGRLPQAQAGQRLIALRYFIENGGVWTEHFAWQGQLSGPGGNGTAAGNSSLVADVYALWTTIEAIRDRVRPDHDWLDLLFRPQGTLAKDVLAPKSLELLVGLSAFPEWREAARTRLRDEAATLFRRSPAHLDRVYLATVELDRYPATTVSAGDLKYVLVADKGEMGVRAVRETVALEKTPVVLHSIDDDARALQVRLAKKHGGFCIGLNGSFRETYANFTQITARICDAFRERFADAWDAELARAALYPGYGPLAENAAAIRHFRQHGIVFVGPMQDVVLQVGDKRQFRSLAESIDPNAVTPGIVLSEDDPALLLSRIRDAYERRLFSLPGRVKAANGGGGRGQAIVATARDFDGALHNVLGAIRSNGWDPGVMFEQNIPETVHLEVQVLRDRFGNTRHFGMRDCTEQRASQKIQEEASPAILQHQPELRRQIEAAAVKLADRVGYVGAGTVELMYKAGKVYFLEMNTRIQVEHPVTEACHRVRTRSGRMEPLNLVALQLRLADGQPIEFRQEDVVQTHVAREFRINAESWNPEIKDPRDGEMGLFFPNGGVFDRISVPSRARVLRALQNRTSDVSVRFDTGFARGDVLVNKDPTFGKLIVAVPADQESPYELLRQASLAVLSLMRIEGREVRPDGTAIEGSTFRTNMEAHRWILEHDISIRHAAGGEVGERHVNWVVDALRKHPAPPT